MCILKTGISNDIRILSNLNQEVQFRFWMPINSTDLSLSHCVLRAGLWALPGMWNKCMAAYPTSRDGLSHSKLWHLCISSAFGGFPDSSVGIESTCNAGDASSILGSGRSPGEGIGHPLQYSWASLVAQLIKNLPAVWETWVRSLGWEDPLEKGKATHSSILA